MEEQPRATILARKISDRKDDAIVSVVLPVYDVEPYVETRFVSILAQTYTDFELIAVDDGSTDGCSAILYVYATQDPRMRVVHQPNRGFSAACNGGVELTVVGWLLFINSDDYLHPRMLERLLATADCTGFAVRPRHRTGPRGSGGTSSERLPALLFTPELYTTRAEPGRSNLRLSNARP